MYLSPIFKEFNIYKRIILVCMTYLFSMIMIIQRKVFLIKFKSCITRDNDLLDGYKGFF